MVGDGKVVGVREIEVKVEVMVDDDEMNEMEDLDGERGDKKLYDDGKRESGNEYRKRRIRCDSREDKREMII